MKEETNLSDYSCMPAIQGGVLLGLVNLLEPDPATIHIEDIAHALARQCRFGGHTARFYSVAEHCIWVAEAIMPSELQRAALLHDAAEAYLMDLPRPLKQLLPAYAALERRMEEAIRTRFDCVSWHVPAIKTVDNYLCAVERHWLMGGVGVNPEYWAGLPGIGPACQTLACMPPAGAEDSYLWEFNHIKERISVHG